MNADATPPSIAHLGEVEVDLAARRLRRGGEVVELQEKPWRLLEALLARPGELVSRETLRQALWPGVEHLDFDANLHAAVRKLRQAGAEDDDDRRWERIRTSGGPMTEHLSRRTLIGAGAAASLIGWPAPSLATDATPSVGSFPTTAPERAKEMVGVSHGNLERVKELLGEDPQLALAAWDWGFGDWETALGAASHVGRLDIIEVLMAHGARPDLFTLAALDRVDAVRAVCSALPGCQSRRGPHGITLLAHARNGKASRVEAYLTELGGADEGEPHLELQEGDVGRYLGRYREQPDGRTWTVDQHRTGDLQLGVDGGSPRMLRHLGDHAFTPAGAPKIQVRFEIAGGHARAFEIARSIPPIRAMRIDG